METMKVNGPSESSYLVSNGDEKWKNNLIESLKKSEEEIYKCK